MVGPGQNSFGENKVCWAVPEQTAKPRYERVEVGVRSRTAVCYHLSQAGIPWHVLVERDDNLLTRDLTGITLTAGWGCIHGRISTCGGSAVRCDVLFYFV
jgi:hypothetical protein